MGTTHVQSFGKLETGQVRMWDTPDSQGRGQVASFEGRPDESAHAPPPSIKRIPRHAGHGVILQI